MTKNVDIYVITNKLNGKRYVGKTARGYQLRFEEHCKGREYGVSSYLSNAIWKHGRENFEIELLESVPESDWMQREIYHIENLNTLYTHNGYNITKGGDDNPMNNEEVRKRHKEKMSTPERREQVSKQMTGRQVSDETRAKISSNNLKNVDKVTSGFKKYNDSRKNPVAIVDNDDNIIQVFESLSDAIEHAGGKRTDAGILKTFVDKYNQNGKRSKFKGYMWTFKI